MKDYIVWDDLRNSIIDVINYYMQEDVEHVCIACVDGVYEMHIDRSSEELPKNIKKIDDLCIGFYTLQEDGRPRLKYDIISKENANKYEGTIELTEYVCPICGHKHKYFYNAAKQCPLCEIGELQEVNKNKIL